MSLRSQIHDAIDDIATPAPMLERRVKVFVHADNATRDQLRVRPRPSWTIRFRGTLALVAAALVVAIVGGLFLGGRIWRNQNLPPQTVGVNELKSLENRALNYPVVPPGGACPSTALHLEQNVGMVLGEGPVFLGNTDVFERDDWGFWVAVGFVYNATKPGLTLIRAKDLKAGSQVAFATYPLEETPIVAVGPVLGASTVAGHRIQFRSEAALFDPWHLPPNLKLGPRPELVVLFGMQQGGSGCIGFQIDGPGFSENFVGQPAVPSF